MSHQDCKPQAIICARGLRCAPCLRARPKLKQRPARIPKCGQFGDYLGIDIIFVKDSAGETHKYLNVLEMTGRLQICMYLETREPAEILRKVQDGWLNWAGPPKAIYCDKDGSFDGGVC